MTVQIYITLKNECSSCAISLSTPGIVGLFNSGNCDNGVPSRCGFDLHFSDDLGSLFIALLAFLMFSFVKCLFKPFAHVFTGLSVLW